MPVFEIPATVLMVNDVMKPEYREIVAKRSLDFLDKATTQGRAALEAAIQRQVSMRGFAHPIRALHGPKHAALVSATIKASQTSDAVLGALLRVWDESQPELHQAALQHLQNSPDPVDQPAVVRTEFPFMWRLEDMEAAARELIKQHPGFEHDDAALMLCYVAGRAPFSADAMGDDVEIGEESGNAQEESMAPGDDPASPGGTTSEVPLDLPPVLNHFMDYLLTLPPDAAEWDLMGDYARALEALVGVKLAQREEGRIRLREALLALRIEADSPLAWWHFDVSDWSADRSAPADTRALAEVVARWTRELLEHWEISQARSPDRVEEQARRARMAYLEPEIERCFVDLGSALGREAGEPQDPGTGPMSPRPAQTAGTESVQPVAEGPAPQTEARDDRMDRDVHTPGAEEGKPLDALVVAGELEPRLSEGLDVGEAPADELPDDAGSEAEEPEAAADTAASDESSRIAEASPAIVEPVEDRPVARAGTTSMSEGTASSDGEQEAGDESLSLIGEAVEAAKSVASQQSGAEVPEPATADVSTAAVREAETGEVPETPTEIAPDVDSDEVWKDLLWDLVAEDDLAGAYWLARSLTAQGRPAPVPEWLLAALQASRWITAETLELSRGLLEITQAHTPEGALELELLALAAALQPALVAPSTGMMSWLNAPPACAALRELTSTVQTFAGYRLGLHPEDALGVAGEEERDEAVARAAREACRWLEEALTRRERVTSVWRGLTGPRGELRELLGPVSDDRREQVDRVRSGLAFWRDRGAVYKRFDEINAAGSIGRPERVTGGGKQDLYREVERAADLAARWCELVERAREIAARGNRFHEQITMLRNRVEQALPGVEAELTVLAGQDNPEALKSSVRALQASLLQLRRLLNLPATPEQRQAVGRPGLKPAMDTDSLDAVLAQRLLLLPEVELDDSGMPTPGGLRQAAGAVRLAREEGRTPEQGVRQWLGQQDYRFHDRLVTIPGDEGRVVELQRLYEESLTASRTALRAAISETGSMVEQALMDEAIDSEQRARYGAAFESLSIEEVRNFRSKLLQLEAIRDEIQEGYERRLAYLREQHEAITRRLKTSSIPPERQQGALALVEDALERGDVRVAVEAMSRLQEALDAGADLPDDWYAPAASRDVLQEFNLAAPRIEKVLDRLHGDLSGLARAAKEGESVAGIPFAELMAPRREEVTRAFSAWRSLRQSVPKTSSPAPQISVILRYLGFSTKTGDSGSVTIADAGGDWLHARAEMSAGDLARPMPEFGTQAQGHYDVICLWERPGADTIAARLSDQNLDIHTVIVLYLGRITARQKRDVVRVSRGRELAIAVLDESLLVFLAQEKDVRLPAFLRCALPFAALNPYRPFQAGDVPPEMFYGRQSMARELQRPGGSSLVYGGRQLGKSALLRHAQRQFHDPGREQYAWVENMKLVFDPSAGKTTANVWRSLRDGFKAHQLFDSRITTDDPSEIARRLRTAMKARPRQRVLVMLDEADEFLDADARDGFRTVIALRELMLDSGQRFKVVLAGLQNVQRFQGIANQPLAHFGTPLCVGPLEPSAAQQLVRQPLEMLGYRFTDDGAVLRILSYTNYHAGLIQYFCQELLKHLRDRSRSAVPPFDVRQEEIEAVYRSQQVRNTIRERLEWTLALDTHYQAIAWALIEDQARDHDGYGRAYAPSGILQLARDWWPAGFRDTDSDQMRGWLDELCGLGVLVRNVQGHYRLRSPNMVRLLGKETDIGDRLLELGMKVPVTSMEADTHHAPLDAQATQYSPFTYADERSLSVPRFGVGLVFASDALGLGLLPAAIRRFLPPNLPAGAGDCTEIPARLGAGEMDAWLKQYLAAHAGTERMILYQQESQVTPEALAASVAGAMRFCQRHQATGRWLRVLLLFDPMATWQWLRLPPSTRRELEDAADAAVSPRLWTLPAVRRRLAQHEKMDAEDRGSKEALHATGGWSYLLNELFRRSGKEIDLHPAAEQLGNDLDDPVSALAREFRSRVGVAESAVAEKVLKFIVEEANGELPEEYLAPDMIGCDPPLSPDLCEQARDYLLRMSLVRLENETLIADRTIMRVTGQS
jgi:hypothetical protein